MASQLNGAPPPKLPIKIKPTAHIRCNLKNAKSWDQKRQIKLNQHVIQMLNNQSNVTERKQTIDVQQREDKITDGNRWAVFKVRKTAAIRAYIIAAKVNQLRVKLLKHVMFRRVISRCYRRFRYRLYAKKLKERVAYLIKRLVRYMKVQMFTVLYGSRLTMG